MDSARALVCGILLLAAGILRILLPVGQAASQSGELLSASTALQSDLRITEVLANPTGSDTYEWIEIGNLGTLPADLGPVVLKVGSKTFSIIETDKDTLGIGEYLYIPKTISSITLTNKGNTVTLLSGSVVLDEWVYPETAEEVSVGYANTGELRSFCVPTPGRANDVILVDPQIRIQSGEREAVGSVSLNIETVVFSGSLTSANCYYNYSDGYTSSSCNPPSHTFTEAGDFSITLQLTTLCNERIERTLTGAVLVEHEEENLPIVSEVTKQPEEVCVLQTSTGVVISEFLANPLGDDAAGEWIELQNVTSERIDLCGWSIDDEEGGSSPFTLDDIHIPPQSFIVLYRSNTGLALNNDADEVRLFAPDSVLPHDIVLYQSAPEHETYARTEQGIYEWTKRKTPGVRNVFGEIERALPASRVSISSILPAPFDGNEEWIELVNIGNTGADLTGFTLDNRTGGSKAYTLSGVYLLPAESLKFFNSETHIRFTDAQDIAQLRDPSGVVVSAMSFSHAEQGKVYTMPHLTRSRVPAYIHSVIDGQTVGVRFPNPDDLELLPDEVKRFWLGSAWTEHPVLPIHILGVIASQGSYTFLVQQALGEKVYLEFDEILWDEYGNTLAYVSLDSGKSLGRMLLSEGVAFADTAISHVRSIEYALLAPSSTEVASAEEVVTSISFSTGVLISEVYPSPGSGEEEWVELFNPTTHDVFLTGWQLDDVRGSGSRAWKFPVGFRLAAGEYAVLDKTLTKLALNNSGDEVHLISPDGVSQSVVTFGTVKKGVSVVQHGEEICLTTTPTPGRENVCDTKPVKSVSTSTARTAPSGLRIKYENLLPEETKATEMVALPDLYQDLKHLTNQFENTSTSDSSWEFDLISFLGGIAFAVCCFAGVLAISNSSHLHARILDIVKIVKI